MTRSPADNKQIQVGVAVAAALVVGTLVRLRIGTGSWGPVIASALISGGLAAILYGAFKTADTLSARPSGSPEDAATRRQRARNIAIGLALAALVGLFYIATIVRLGGNVAKRVL